MMSDFNAYSELVALQYAKRDEGTLNDDGLIQWNRGYKSCVRDYMDEIAQSLGIKLVYKCGKHSFGVGDKKRVLEYLTVRIEGRT